MSKRTHVTAFVAAACLGSTLFVAGPARADHHFMKIVEVFAGTGGFDDAEFVELRMYSADQHLVGGHHVKVYGPTGALTNTHTFPGNASDPDDQETILLASSAAESFFSVTDDFGLSSPSTLGLNAAGGKVCFESSTLGVIDCVAWGSYSGSTSGVGTPFNAVEGIPSGATLSRKLGANSTLEAGDDTNSSANDFQYAAASPNPNGTLVPTGSAPGGSLRFDTTSLSGAEDGAPLAVDVIRTGGVGTVTVDYATADHPTTIAPATAGSDYTAEADQLSFTDTDPQPVDVALIPDGACERDERFLLQLRDPTDGAVLGSVIDRTAEIVDDDAPDEGCYVFESTTYQATEGGTAEVVIIRTGDLTTPGANVRFTTTPGTASAGEFVDWNDPIPFETNIGILTVEVELPEDTKDEPNETFTVTLSNPQPSGAILGTPATATVTIVDDDEVVKPTSRVTRPAHAKTYRRGRLVDLVGTASDKGGSGLDRVQVALRRNMTDGSCRWWTGAGWTSRSCSRKLFKKAAGKANWAYSLNKLLPRSRGTTTRRYTVFSRAIDRSGNVESRFTRGRNMNTFEIR